MKEELIASIKKAKKIMEQVPDSFHGGLEHARMVVEISKEILESEPETDRNVIIVAAWWHDTGRIDGNEGHEKRSAEMASKDLQQRGFDDEFCQKVYQAIAHHRFDMKPTTLEGIIIRDADKLALLDPKRWQQAIKDKEYHKFEHTIHVLPDLRNGILQRPVSKKIYDRLLPDFLDSIKSVNSTDFESRKQEILALNL